MWGYILAGAFLFWIAKCEQAKASQIVRNPARRRRRNPATLTAADKTTLAKAEQIAEQFHGAEGYRQIIELSESERRLPKFVVELGAIPKLEYEPNRGSERKDWTWVHKSGDSGPFAPESPEQPVLAVSPTTRRPLIMPMRSKMKMDPRFGLVG